MFTSAAYPGSTSWRSSSPVGARGASPTPSAEGAEATGGGGGRDSRKQSGLGVSPNTCNTTNANNSNNALTQQQEEHQQRLSLMQALLEKFPQPLRLQVTIPYATAVYSVSGLYITYCMQIKDEVNDVIWQCAHRYSEYRALHMHLGKGFASGFPPVLLRNKSNRSKKEIENRRIRLEVYMRKVVGGIIEAYNGNLGRWASQHAVKIVNAAAAEVAKHKGAGGGKRGKNHQHRAQRVGGGQRHTDPTTQNDMTNNNAAANNSNMYNAFVGPSECSASTPTTPTSSRAASPDPGSNNTGRLSEVALQQYMLLLQQQRQQMQEHGSGINCPTSSPHQRGHGDELQGGDNGRYIDGGDAATEERGGAGGGDATAFSALISMVPATMPPYLAQLTQLLRFVHHPFLDDWESVTFLAAPTFPDDDDRLSVASEANHYGRREGSEVTGGRRGGRGVDILGDDAVGGSNNSNSRTSSRRSRSSFDGSSSSSPLAFGGDGSRPRSSGGRSRASSSASSALSNSAHNSPLAHPSAVATRWRPPAVLPGLRLGLSMPLVNISLSIESVWEAHVRGEKGTRKGQLRHRYDEASAICAHIASREHLLDCPQMQEFIMEFRRKHPIQAYLRFERVLENNTPNTASRSDRVSGGGRQGRARGGRGGSQRSGSSSASGAHVEEGGQGSAFEENPEEEAAAGGVGMGMDISARPIPLARRIDGDEEEEGAVEAGGEASLDLDLDAVVGSPLCRHHRSIAGSSTDSIHENFPETLALATKAAGGVGVLYDPALDEATASMALAQAEENASCPSSSVGLNSSIVTAHMHRMSSIARSARGLGGGQAVSGGAGGEPVVSSAASAYPKGIAAENQFLDSIGLHFTLRPDFQKFDLEAVKEAKAHEKMRRGEEGGEAGTVHSFMPRRSISVIDTAGGGLRPTVRSRTPNPNVPTNAARQSTANVGCGGSSGVGVLRSLFDLVSGSGGGNKSAQQRTPPGGSGSTADKKYLGNPNASVSLGGGSGVGLPPPRTLLPFSDTPVPTACAEYVAKIKGEEVEDCRCTDAQFCSNASAAPREDDEERGVSSQKAGEVLGDVYITQSGYSIIVCPPPVPKVTSGAASHGSNRD